ncbi:hypothetical protein IJ674_10295 [bacterium]|nr:hypothetical protein [bacterium]
MKVKDFVKELLNIENQDAELIFEFSEGGETTDYSLQEDTTKFCNFAYLTVKGCLEKDFC